MMRTMAFLGTMVSGAILLCLPFMGSAEAQSGFPSALAGTVTSQEEGAMEGVLVSAKR